MKVLNREAELGKVELHVLLCEHDLIAEAIEEIAAPEKVQKEVQFALGLKGWTTGLRKSSENEANQTAGIDTRVRA